MNDFLLNIIASLNKQLSKRQLKADVKTMDNSMYVKVITKLSMALSKRQLKKDIKELNDLYIQIGANVKIDKNTKSQLQKRIKELQSSIENIEIKAKVAKKNIGSEVDSARRAGQTRANKVPISFDLEIKKSKAISDIEYLGKRFSKLFSNASAKQKYNNLLNSAFSISDQSQLRSVRTQISAFTSELKSNGLASKSLRDKWKSLVERSKDLFSAASIVTTIFTQVRQAVTTFVDLDTAMTDLYKVTDDITSRDQFSGLLTKWNKLAQDLSITTKSLINSAEEWSKIGFDLDMSEQLAQVTAIFEKTAKISNEKANSTLISVAQAFPQIDNYGEDDYVERVTAIGDKINKVGNEFSISSEGISDALQNSAAALRMANNDLDESIAISTTANKIFQDPDEVGNMSKILSARLRGQKGILEELGEDTDGMIESVSKIQTQILNLTHNKVNIFEDDNETLKSTYQMVLEIGKVFDTLSDKDQAALLEIMGGKQRMSAVASLLLNYEELEKVKEASMNADKSMEEEYNKYLESAEAHITTFKEKLTEAYSGFMSGDLVKYTADIGSGLLDLVTSTDLLRHSLLAVVALKVGKGISSIGAAVASTTKQMNTLGNAIQQVKNLPLDDSSRTNALYKLGESTKNLTEKNLELLLSQKNLTQQDRLAILSKHSLTEEESLAKLEKMGLTTATNAQTAANTAETASTFTLSGALTSLKASAVGMLTSIKTAIANNPLGFAFTLLTTTISVATSVISSHNQELDEAKEKTKELANEVAEEEENLVSLIAQYNKLDKTDRSTENTEQIKKLNEQINEALGDQADNIDLVNGKLDEQSDKLKRNLLQKLQDDKTQLDASVSVAKGDYDEGLDLGFTGIDFWGNIGEVLEKNGAKSVDGKFSVDKGNVDAILKSQDTETQIAQLKQWLEILNNADAKDGLGTYSDYIATLQDSLKKVEDKKSTLDKALEKQMINQGEQDILRKPISNRKDFETYRNELSKTYKENDNVKNQLLDFIDAIYPDYAEKIKETTDKLQDLNSQSSQPQTSSFSSIWNSKDYKSIKKKLESLNKQGKLTPETIKSVEDYKKMWKDTGLSIKDFIRQIRQAATEQDKLSMFSKDTKKVTKSYKDFKKNGYVSSGSLNDMPDSFKNLDGYSDFNKTVRNKKTSAKQKQSAFNELVTEYLQEYKIFEGIYKKFKGIQDKIDTAKSSGDSKSVEKYTKQFEKQQTKYATALRDAGVTNSDQLVQYFANNLNKQEELTKQSSAELNKLDSKDLANYVKMLNEKGKLSADSLSKIGTNTQTLINTLGTAYTTDVQNWMNALNDKAKAWNSFVKAVGSDGTKKDTESKYSSIVKNASTTSSPTENREGTQKFYQAAGAKGLYQKATEAAKAAEAVVDLDLKKVKGKFKVNYHPNTSTGDGTSKNGSSKNGSSKTKTEINWLERRLTRMQSIIDLTASKLQNLFSVKAKNSNLDNQIKQSTKLMNQYKIAADTYIKKANSVAKSGGLSKDIINKVQSGEITKSSYSKLIKKYGQKKADKINSYIDYYDKSQDAKKNAIDLESKIRGLKQDKLQNYVDLYDSRTSRAKAKEVIAIGATDQNKAVDTQIKNTKLSYDYQIKIAKLTNDKAKADQLEYEKQKAIVDLKKQQIENLKTEYDNRIGLVQNSQQDANNQLSQMEARGQIIQSSYYSSLNNYENQKLSQLNSELSKLQAQQNTFTKYSQEWYDLQSDIQSVKNAINDVETAIIENNKKVGELRQAMYDDIASRNSNISTEASFLAGLLGDNLTDDKTGNFTKEGLAMLGTYAIDMESNTSTTLSYKKDREELEKQIADYKKGNSHALDAYGSLEAAEKKLDEIIQKQQDAISAEYANEKQIYDLMTQRYETQLSYMQSIIDAKKNLLNMEKDIYDYEKNISNQTKSIASLEKQLTALQGDDSEAGRLRRSQLQQSLDEANQELQDTEYERYISDQQNMLDNLYSQYEDLIHELEKNFEEVVNDGVELINGKSGEISTAITNYATNYGYNPSKDMKSILGALTSSGDGDVKTLPGAINNGFSNLGMIFQKGVTDIINAYTGSKSDTDNSNNGSNNSSNPTNKQQSNTADYQEWQRIAGTLGGTTQKLPENYANQILNGIKSGQSNTTKVETTAERNKKIQSAISYINSHLSPAKKKKSEYSAVNQSFYSKWGKKVLSDSELKNLAGIVGVTYNNANKTGNLYKRLKDLGIAGFKRGGIGQLVKASGEDGLALVRNGEGFIAPEHVDAIKDLVNIVPDMTQFTKSLTNIKPVNRNIGNTFGDIVINAELPNVKDSYDFIDDIKNNRKTQQALIIATKDVIEKGRITNNIQSVR